MNETTGAQGQAGLGENKLILEDPRTASQRLAFEYSTLFLVTKNRKCICLFLAANKFIRGKPTDFLRGSAATTVGQVLPLEWDETAIHSEALVSSSKSGVFDRGTARQT